MSSYFTPSTGRPSSFWETASTLRWDNLSAPLTPAVHRHLRNVYSNLAAMLAVSAIGAYADVTGVVTGGIWSAFAGLGCLLAFNYYKAASGRNDTTRKALLYGFAFLKGLSIGPLISSALYFDPSIIPKSLLGTALIFASFTLSVLTSPSRSAIYTRGLIATGTSLLFFLSIFNLFAGSSRLFSLELYLGLLVFAGFVVFDTQVMVQNAEVAARAAGKLDYLEDSMQLYVDFVAIFVRLLVLLQKKAADKEEDRRRKKRDERRR
ncbi:inhibitor of apoptosis-promoting Bax1-domain-containing protein [Fimicolochytrium jonesii]|uniref:inhibitor of apoptosis-promoting Bax1-domain-containing protein n=1 Tax=Fimicolochytrium jonesii TaxID=1396493 RepID=UPI0022FEAE8E|nr:inhibitor of apoptosis-promoting Bax1-domain-containing protein [Fimicolochytrium jonesii]KAI8819610.1 inhibitor of apoptosis-promoting Bax1-domain-containing protein [Fimicolochytrium jonesii]